MFVFAANWWIRSLTLPSFSDGARMLDFVIPPRVGTKSAGAGDVYTIFDKALIIS